LEFWKKKEGFLMEHRRLQAARRITGRSVSGSGARGLSKEGKAFCKRYPGGEALSLNIVTRNRGRQKIQKGKSAL